MARAIDKRIMLDLIIEAKKTDPETGPFSEWLAEYLVDHLPTLTPPNEPLTQADLNKMYLNEVWLEYPDGSGETALVVMGKLYDTSSLEGAGLDLEEYIMGETMNNPTGTYKVYRRPPEGEKEKT